MRRFQFILSGLNIEQLKNIEINNNDVLDALSGTQEWNPEQVILLFYLPTLYTLKSNNFFR